MKRSPLGRGRRSPSVRPVAALVVGLLLTGCGVLGEEAVVVDPGATPGPGGINRLQSEAVDPAALPGTGDGDDDGASTAALTVPPATGPPRITGTTSVPFDGAVLRPLTDPIQVVAVSIESHVADVAGDAFGDLVLATLNDPRGWPRAGFSFEPSATSPFRVVLAEGAEVDQLCLPLETHGTVSCQNGPVVAINADRWRDAVDHWDGDLATYRGYLINHEVGHLLGQRHPQPRCPVPGHPAGVMEQQTGGLEGCTGNAWPRDWEIELAATRPVVYAPLPDWGPEPGPVNAER